MKHVVFPFIHLYERLNLKQRWWHRLAVVMFFITFLISAAFILVVAYAQLRDAFSESDRQQALSHAFPQLEIPENSTTSIDFDFVEMPNNGFDSSKYSNGAALDCYDRNGQLLVDEAAAFDGIVTQCAPGETSKPKTERINVQRDRLHYVERAEACQKSVVAEYAKGDAEIYRQKMDACITPAVNAEEKQELDLTNAIPIKSVFKQDMEMNSDAKKVQIPKVGLVAFPPGMEEKKITRISASLYDTVSAAERRAKALILIYAFIALFTAFYTPQIGYRLILYIVFGADR